MATNKRRIPTPQEDVVAAAFNEVENAPSQDISVTEEVMEMISSPIEKPNDDAEAILDSINDGIDKVAGVGRETIASTRTADESIPLTEEIACKSVVFGGLTWVSPKTNSHYRWNDIGSVTYIPFSELIVMNNTSRRFLFDPMIVVQDARVVKHFHLLEVYKNVATIQKLDASFKKPLQEISAMLDVAISVNMREVLISKVRQMLRDGSLNDYRIIKLLEGKLCFDLSEDV